MKKKIVSLSLALVVMVTVVGVVAAQSGIPGSGWWSGEQVQNVGTAAANIVVTAYDASGASTYSSSQSVAIGGAFTFIPSSFAGMPAGFIGSAVVSPDQPIKAIVNVTNQQAAGFGVAGGKAAAQYQGTESADTTLYFPLVKNNRFGKTTSFYIQNAGTADAPATAVFKMDDGGVYTYTTPSIGANKMVVVNPSDANVPTSGTNRNNIGSLTVTSAQPMAGTVLEYTQGEAVATVLNGTRGFTAADFDTKAYAPVVKNNRFGRFTGIQVQNVSAGPVDITIDYVGVGGCTGSYSETALAVPAGSSKTFVQSGTGTFPVNCTGTATINATGNIVAIVNEQNLASSTTAGITYSAMPDNSKTTKVSAPLFKDRRFGFSTGLQIQNVGSGTATNLVATFTCNGAAAFTAISAPQTVNAGAAKLFYRPATMPAGTFTVANPFSSQNENCAVTVTSDQPIVAIANEAPETAGALDDNNYEGFNLIP